MPTYEYECDECGHKFEEFQGINDKPVARCPRCQGKVRRLISGGSGLIFKGSGFYITENRGKDYKEKAKSEKSGGEPAKGGESGKGGDSSKGGESSKGGDSSKGGSTGSSGPAGGGSGSGGGAPSAPEKKSSAPKDKGSGKSGD